MNFIEEEIWSEDIESIETKYYASIRKTHLIVKRKDQPFGKDLGTLLGADELVEKLKRFIGLPY